ncbi:hypothetical protein [Methylopila turkensis]|uniref:Uncharacterized protein n=1 Tax=Methylopila turkensis TaxID=1437816 RepID=A0A9W6JIT3_9HYPH|nr:hypothetical protein [Methylopila turkensis]GLK78435.1 hypothetical protein GCM10008174_01760 [Methylopila turkensis]
MDLSEGVTTAIAVIGVIGGLWRYWKNSEEQAEQRRRNDGLRVADEIELLNKDPAVVVAFRLIDWCPTYVDLVVDGVRKPVLVGPAEFCDALRHHGSPRAMLGQESAAPDALIKEVGGEAVVEPSRADGFSIEQQAIRDVFDAFLGRLERVEMLIRVGVIPQDLFGDQFSYWLEAMGEIEPTAGEVAGLDDARRRALWRFIRAYQFNGVIRLFGRYGRTLSI